MPKWPKVPPGAMPGAAGPGGFFQTQVYG